MNRYKWCLVTTALLMALIVACKSNSGYHTTPVYTEYSFPASVIVNFPKAKAKEGEEKKPKALPQLQFNIDHRARKIWNKIPLPYESKFDSLDITIAVTSQATVTIINEKTKKTTLYTSNRQAQRIDATGGRLTLTVELDKKPTLTYDLRIQTYGYDPDKFTWTKAKNQLPLPAVEAKVIQQANNYYWLAKDRDNQIKLYGLDTKAITFTPISDAQIPQELLPNSLLVDKQNKVWGITKEGKLYSSQELKHWEQYPNSDVVITQLVGEATMIDGSSRFLAIGKAIDTDEYATYTITPTKLVLGEPVKPDFPVQEAYIYTYTQAGATSTTIYSGLTAKGTPAKWSYFLSGSTQWGLTPYQKKENPLPTHGGLFLRTDRDAELFVIGGYYKEGQESNTIKRSADRGITWSPLPNQVIVDGTFTPRHHASGLAYGSGKTLNIIIFGGVNKEVPMDEIWHGRLDTTGGIINSFN